ncbi:ABC transporter ATP-binding protein, partial [bacterium]
MAQNGHSNAMAQVIFSWHGYFSNRRSCQGLSGDHFSPCSPTHFNTARAVFLLMIEIRNLCHQYSDGTHALKGIDLTISDGEFLLICGPNGSGKTTLIRLICGLFKPTAGSIRLDGLEDPHASKEIRRLIGMVFQDADSQIVGETIREDIAFGPENLGLPHEEISERVDWALRVMELEAISEKPCYLLSGGEKRRLSIAGVLAMKPKTILFDEPFSHLDYPGIREVLKHMVDLHGQKHTLVVTTHD